MKLYKHQQRFIDQNPDRALLVWETGLGKSLAACEWLKKRPRRGAVVVCPKAIVGKWKRDLSHSGVSARVLTRDEIKKADLSKCKALVLDEAQDYASPLFDKNRSQRATKIYSHIKANPETHVLLLTATPVRSTPWNIHTLACYLQRVWPVKAFRDEFSYMTDMFGRYHYELKSDWRTRVRPYVEEVADIVLMRDCVDVPPQTDEIVEIPWTKQQEAELSSEYQEPSAAWYARHRAEQGQAKLEVLKGLLDGYRKAIVVCNYTEQISRYASELSKERAVFVLQGSTKDQDAVITAAREADDCVFIVQASMGNGFDCGEFSVMIFASQSFKFVDNIQAKGRILRVNNLHRNHFIYLLAGKNDKSVFETIKKGHDFHPPSYMN